MEIYDDYERNKGVDDDVEFFRRAKWKIQTRVDAVETNEEVETELVCATQANVVIENAQLVQQSLHSRIRIVLAHQNHDRSSSSVMRHSLLCYCGVECNIVVSKSRRNAGRHFYGRKAYIDAQTHREFIVVNIFIGSILH